MSALMDDIIFHYRHRCDDLPQEEVNRLLGETGYQPRDALSCNTCC